MVGMHTGLLAIESETLERCVQIGLASGRVINLAFPEDPPADATTDHPLAERFWKDTRLGQHLHISCCTSRVGEIFRGSNVCGEVDTRGQLPHL
jgi:hypothetical protein